MKAELKKAELRVSKFGKRMTPARRNVLGILTKHDKALTAYEIVDLMPEDTKPMTVYRSLDFFTEAGLVHRIESMNAYVYCSEHHCAHKDSQFMICRECKSVEEIHNHALDSYMNKIFLDQKFEMQKKIIEVHGTCSACQS